MRRLGSQPVLTPPFFARGEEGASPGKKFIYTR